MKRVVGASQVLTITDRYTSHLVKPLDKYKSRPITDCRHVRAFTFLTACGELIDYSRRLRFPDRWLFFIGRSYRESVSCPACAVISQSKEPSRVHAPPSIRFHDGFDRPRQTKSCRECGDENSVATIHAWMRCMGWIEQPKPKLKSVAAATDEVPF